MLAKALETDQVNRSRLIKLRRAMTKEFLAEGRILEVLLGYPDVMKQLFADFVGKFKPKDSGSGKRLSLTAPPPGLTRVKVRSPIGYAQIVAYPCFRPGAPPTVGTPSPSRGPSRAQRCPSWTSRYCRRSCSSTTRCRRPTSSGATRLRSPSAWIHRSSAVATILQCLLRSSSSSAATFAGSTSASATSLVVRQRCVATGSCSCVAEPVPQVAFALCGPTVSSSMSGTRSSCSRRTLASPTPSR